MGFFTPRAPKERITAKEIKGTALHSGLYSKLKQHGFNDRDGLDHREMKTVEAIMSGHLDAEKHNGHYFKGIDAAEAEKIIEQVKNHPDFTERKAAHVEKHLREYLDKRVV